MTTGGLPRGGIKYGTPAPHAVSQGEVYAPARGHGLTAAGLTGHELGVVGVHVLPGTGVQAEPACRVGSPDGRSPVGASAREQGQGASYSARRHRYELACCRGVSSWCACVLVHMYLCDAELPGLAACRSPGGNFGCFGILLYVCSPTHVCVVVCGMWCDQGEVVKYLHPSHVGTGCCAGCCASWLRLLHTQLCLLQLRCGTVHGQAYACDAGHLLALGCMCGAVGIPHPVHGHRECINLPWEIPTPPGTSWLLHSGSGSPAASSVPVASAVLVGD